MFRPQLYKAQRMSTYYIHLQQTLLLFLPLLLSSTLFFWIPGPACSGCSNGGHGKLHTQKTLKLLEPIKYPRYPLQYLGMITLSFYCTQSIKHNYALNNIIHLLLINQIICMCKQTNSTYIRYCCIGSTCKNNFN